MKLVYSLEARADLEGILSYIAERNQQAAADLAARVKEAETSIILFPKAARYDN